MMHRRSFLGLLVAAVGFRLKAGPRFVGVDLAQGRDCSVIVITGNFPGGIVDELHEHRHWTRADVARFYDVPVDLLGTHFIEIRAR